MATSTQINALTALYVGYFDRAPDPAGLQFWIEQIDNGREFNTIAADFAASPEAVALYPYLTTPAVSSPAAFITSIYANLFGRAPDAAGLEFWTGVLNDGSVSVADMIEAIIMGARDDATAGTFDKTVLDNKVEVGLDFASDAANTSGFEFDAAAKSAAVAAVNGVTEDEATVVAAKAGTDAFLTGAANQGNTFTLTTGIDNLAGTANNDTFIGDQAVTSAADQVSGSAGTDTFKLFTTGAVTLPVLSGVENVWIQGAAANVDVSSIADVKSLELSKLDMTAARAVNVTADQKLTVSDTTAGTTDLDLTNATATAQTVAVSKSGDAANAVDIDVAGAAATTLNLEATGKSFVDIDNTGTKLTTVNVSGSADLTIENVDAATTIAVTNTAKTALTTGVAKVAVTGAAGAETVNLTHAAGGAREFSVTTGAGDDKVAFANLTAASDLTDSKVTVSGGEGSDTLAMKSAMGASLSGLTAANFTKKGIANDFEVLEITDQAGAADDVNLARLGSNITKVDYAAGLGDAQTLQGLATGGTVVLGAAAGVITDSLTVSVKDAAVAGSNSDVLNVTLDGLHAAGTLDYGVLTAAAVETINLNSTTTKKTALVAADKNEVDLNVANAQTINITGDVYADIDGSTFGASLNTIDASANTGGVSVTAAGLAQGVVIKGSSKADVLVGGNAADNISGGAGDDMITGGTGLDILAGGDGADTFIYSADDQTNVASAAGEKISDFALTSDKISFDTTADAGTTNDAKVVGDVVNQFLNGFASGSLQSTISAAASADAALALALGATVTDNDVFGFTYSGNSYIVHADGAGTAGNVVELSGVAGSKITEVGVTDVFNIA